jgi:SSS family solute:Na+ symporter
MIEPVKLKAAAEKLSSSASVQQVTGMAAQLQPADYGDKVLPHFMVTKIPTGLLGLIVSAILSAAMSTISSGMNASATVFTVDIVKKYFRPNISDRQHLRALYIATVVFGIAGLCTGLAMIGSKSVLDTWWELSGIFAGGMLGLFLLGIVSRRAQNQEALTAVLIGIVVIVWMTFSGLLPARYEFLRNPLHKNMIIVVGTLTIFLTGLLLTYTKRKSEQIRIVG